MRKINFSEFQTLIWPKYPNFLCYITLKPVQKKLIFQVLQKTKSWSAHNFQKRTEPKFQKKYHFFLYTGASYFTMYALCIALPETGFFLIIVPKKKDFCSFCFFDGPNWPKSVQTRIQSVLQMLIAIGIAEKIKGLSRIDQ